VSEQVKTISFEDYTAAVERAVAAYPNWRVGQAAFNVLSQMRPDLVLQIQGTNLDPFFDTRLLPKFYDWVQQHWGESATK